MAVANLMSAVALAVEVAAGSGGEKHVGSCFFSSSGSKYGFASVSFPPRTGSLSCCTHYHMMLFLNQSAYHQYTYSNCT